MSITRLNENIANMLTNTTGESGVRLPFPAPTFWVLNGRGELKALAKTAPAAYFGGWATNRDDLEIIAAQTARKVPGGLEQFDFTPRGADESIAVYCKRNLLVAPFGTRISSKEKKSGTIYNGFRKGASPRVQILCYLAEQTEQGIKAWGAIMLSAGGYQAGYLRDAFAMWKKATAQARQQYAFNQDVTFFWASIGTFAAKPEVKMVGDDPDPQKQSPITPIKCFVPETIDQALLERLFVGESVAAAMATCRADAREWLDVYKTPRADTVPASQPELPEEMTPADEEELPL